MSKAHALSRRKRGNVSGAASRSAEARRCPKCGRKAALVRVKDAPEGEVTTYCRWDDCDYARVRPTLASLMADDPRAPLSPSPAPETSR